MSNAINFCAKLVRSFHDRLPLQIYNCNNSLLVTFNGGNFGGLPRPDAAPKHARNLSRLPSAERKISGFNFTVFIWRANHLMIIAHILIYVEQGPDEWCLWYISGNELHLTLKGCIVTWRYVSLCGNMWNVSLSCSALCSKHRLTYNSFLCVLD